MAVPKRKTSTSKKKMRRSHQKLSSMNVVEDKKAVSTNFHIMLILSPVSTTEKNFRYLIINYVKKISIAIDAMGGIILRIKQLRA